MMVTPGFWVWKPAVHAAWVWQSENGKARPIAEVGDPFVLLRPDRGARPRPEWRETYATQRRLYAALSGRVRGLATEDDPMVLRRQLRNS